MGVGLGRRRPAVDQPPVNPDRLPPTACPSRPLACTALGLPDAGKGRSAPGWWISSLVIMEAPPGATGSGGPSTLLARTKASVPPATAEHQDGHRDAPHAQSHAEDQERW